MVFLGLGVLLLVLIIFSQAAFNLKFLSPDTLGETFLLAALSALIFLALLALTLVLLRTLAKLYLERQAGVLGSRFRTKMVLGALVLSFGPVIALFVFSYGLMNRSIDKWFSRPVEEVREQTAAVTSLLAGYAGQNAQSEANAIAASPDTARAYDTGSFGRVIVEFRRREATLQDGFAIALYHDEPQASFQAPVPWHELRRIIPVGSVRPGKPLPFSLKGRDYVLASAEAGHSGVVLVAMPLPPEYSAALKALDERARRYIELRSQNKLIRRTYMQFLLLITTLVLFASTWFALFLSKLVTRPVTALAQATQEISGGNLNYRVDVQGADELGMLVQSFNRMAGELESNRRQIEENQKQLAGANVALEQRRRYMETILESIPSGVLSLDPNGAVTRVNAALIRMLKPTIDVVAGRQADLRLRDLFEQEVAEDLERMTRKADRMGITTAQTSIGTDGSALNVGVTVASMDSGFRPRAERLGYVVVFEDLSDVIKAQKQAAWREVARRIAHEIKNPLTPITLSAERIRRYLAKGSPDRAALEVIQTCADSIAGAAETVRSLVDEFATLARFPQSHPQPADINAIVESALVLFEGRLDGVTVRKDLPPNLPPVLADAEGIKRVVANLVDNAAEAVQDSMLREITISTSLVASRDGLELVVADSGHGVTPEVKEKLFMPYFSTKQRGTGLGLAIVSRIIEDHHGTIRVEENKPVGSRFVVELPLAAETEREAGDAHRASAD